MPILEWLLGSMKKLADAGVDSPRRDSLVLLEDLLGKDRSWVNAHAEYELAQDQVDKLNKLVQRRINREPLAYIRGKAWFYGRFFEVNPNVMIPRPESESFIQLLKEIQPKSLVDVGTGSGVIAITAKLEIPEISVIATDIDKKALKLAQQNAKLHNVEINFISGDLITPPLLAEIKIPDMIVANLPYVPDNLITSPEITREPKSALFSGAHGLSHYKKFWNQIGELSKKPRYILTESLENQHQKLSELAKKAGYKLSKTEVLVQKFELI